MSQPHLYLGQLPGTVQPHRSSTWQNQADANSQIFGFIRFCYTIVVSRKAHRQPLSPLRCPGSQGRTMAALMFHLAPHPHPSRRPK